MTAASLTTVARRWSFVRETDGPNRGAWVSFFQRQCGGQDGDSWCCDFVSVVEDVAYRGRSPLRRTASCQLKLADARRLGLVVTTPAADDLYFFVNADGRAHHIGIVTAVSPLTGIAGNTSEDGQSSNGTGVYEHTLRVEPANVVFVRLPKERS
jgi:hypothetical protein